MRHDTANTPPPYADHVHSQPDNGCVTSNRYSSPSRNAKSVSMSLQRDIKRALYALMNQVNNKVLNSLTQTRPGDQVSIPYPLTALAPPSFPNRPGSSILIECRSQGSLAVVNFGHRWTSGRYRGLLITFDMLPDDVLLKIFDFYLDGDVDEYVEGVVEEQWINLAHVYRRWRSVVFQSPRRLNLQLVCTPYKPVRDTLDIWPPFPLIIYNFDFIYEDERSCLQNIVAGLEHSDRVRKIRIEALTSSEMEYVTDSAAIQKPFPELTDLQLSLLGEDQPGLILPDSFLGGNAPRLRSLELDRVPFPGLLKFLLSATHLVDLYLYGIPSSGYIPPEVMATGLSALTSLKSLTLNFRYARLRPLPALDSRRLPPPPLSRSILPSLTKLHLHGESEYLEEILVRIEAPRLNILEIIFFHQIIFNTPQLFRLISQTPTLRAPEEGYIQFYHRFAMLKFRSQTSDYDALSVQIRCKASEWQLSSLGQVCTLSLPPLSTLEELYISEDRNCPPDWKNDTENGLWLELLHPFAAVKNLYMLKEFVPRIAPALQELVGEGSTEVFPVLENIFLEGFQPSGPLHEGIEKFVAVRRLTSYPVAVSRWESPYWETAL